MILWANMAEWFFLARISHVKAEITTLCIAQRTSPKQIIFLYSFLFGGKLFVGREMRKQLSTPEALHRQFHLIFSLLCLINNNFIKSLANFQFVRKSDFSIMLKRRHHQISNANLLGYCQELITLHNFG